MEVRKIFKAGNSCVISLPLTMMKALELTEGSHVTMEVNREQQELVLKPVVVKKKQFSVDFVRMVDKLLVDYEYTLRGLR
ncbi:AbrB/MazE/SpoVT family DNA-binding domain-containing protein [Azotosporobacter soli]|uniref:AbrB/MazE/SpoVT family DNA-binding domain-containing protein n=1 Tax=Azotosporobacter soli TaxID=3055040 RepID=UPI0031FF0A44